MPYQAELMIIVTFSSRTTGRIASARRFPVELERDTEHMNSCPDTTIDRGGELCPSKQTHATELILDMPYVCFYLVCDGSWL